MPNKISERRSLRKSLVGRRNSLIDHISRHDLRSIIETSKETTIQEDRGLRTKMRSVFTIEKKSGGRKKLVWKSCKPLRGLMKNKQTEREL